MSPPEAGFRCALASLERDETLAGSATNVRTWLLLEHTGPWGVTALRDARLPEGLGRTLQQRAAEHRAKILLIRRHHSRPDTESGLRVFAAYADPLSPRLESGLLGDPREILDVDLGALRGGGSAGLDEVSGADRDLFLVCTNGRHDTCCAERGRPVARALSAAHPEQTWEVSHVGGDRFAGNMVVLPHGLYYGRLSPDSALEVAAAHRRGELLLEHLRGRSSFAMPVQAAEAFLRAELGLTAIDAVRVDRRVVDSDLTTTTMSAGGRVFEVTVRTTRSEAETGHLTCKAAQAEPVQRHLLAGIEPAG